MKKLILSTILVVLGIMVFSQDYPKPDFKYQPMLYTNGELSKLEKQTAEIKLKAKVLGYGGAQQEISVPGGKSPVKVSKNPTFLIWVDKGVDPESKLILTKTTFNKKKRNIPIVNVSAFVAFGARGKSVSAKYHVPFEVKKVQEDIYTITPSSELEPDMEYAFYDPEKTNAQQTKIYLFGTN